MRDLERHRIAGLARLALVLVVLLAGLPAQARVRTCVAVDAGRADDAELQRLVTVEVNRHTSHQVATVDCDAHLRVELIELQTDGRLERFVTAQLDAEVPHREAVGPDGVANAVERALVVVLHNDPRTLEGPGPTDPLGRAMWTFERRGRNHFGLELAEVGVSVGGVLNTVPAAGLFARREVNAVHVGARIAAAGCLADCGNELHLSRWAQAMIEASLFSSTQANTAAFGSVQLGFEVQRFYGPRRYDDDGSSGGATELGPSVALRGGVETMRISNARLQLFAQVGLPLFSSFDRDHGIVRQWTPSLAIGIATVLF